MTEPSRRGRPPLTARKEVRQVSLDAEDAAMFDAAAESLGVSLAALGGKLIKGEMSWADVMRAAARK